MEENEITHFKGLKNHLFLTQHSNLGQAFGGSSLGQTDGENDLAHARKSRLKLYWTSLVSLAITLVSIGVPWNLASAADGTLSTGAPGIVTVAGTGSICYGRNAAGKQARAGGWGHVFGDEGGAFDLARQALRAALRFEEGWGPPTALHRMLLAKTSAGTANDLLHSLYSTDYSKPGIAALARLVDEAAVNGDAVAGELLSAAANQLATLTAAVRSQLFSAGDKVRVAWMGGVFRSNSLRERFRILVELEDGVAAGPSAHGPAVGALIDAFRLAGLNIEPFDIPVMEKQVFVR